MIYTMRKPCRAIVLCITTLYLFSIIQAARSVAPIGSSTPTSSVNFQVQGQVYCDTCRAHFITKLTTFLKGAKVRLECRNRVEDTKLTFSDEGTTDDSGTYHIKVEGDYEDDVCEIKLVKSPDPQCSEISTVKNTRDGARVSLANNSGMSSNVRMANPLGFMKKEAPEDCKHLLDELGVVPGH